GFVAPGVVQGGGQMVAAEVVRESGSACSQLGEPCAPLGDDLVLVLALGRLAHYTPCLRLALMNSSRSPSSTRWVSRLSTPVRRSLMRDWSSTYERIWWPHSMSVLAEASLSRSAWRLRSSSSYKRDFRSPIASARLRCCERSFWHCTTMPVGKWVMRTAESVLLTCWPPAPDARYVSIRSSAGLISTSMFSSTSG